MIVYIYIYLDRLTTTKTTTLITKKETTISVRNWFKALLTDKKLKSDDSDNF